MVDDIQSRLTMAQDYYNRYQVLMPYSHQATQADIEVLKKQDEYLKSAKRLIQKAIALCDEHTHSIHEKLKQPTHSYIIEQRKAEIQQIKALKDELRQFGVTIEQHEEEDLIAFDGVVTCDAVS